MLEVAERISEASVVDAELLAERCPGTWLASTSEHGAHLLGEGRRRSVVVVVVVDELEPDGLAVAAGECEQDGLRCGRGTVFDGES